jgi:DNA-binding MarR family transcriptional regulator
MSQAMRDRRQKAGEGAEATPLAERLHSAALRLIRRLAKSDAAIGLSRPKASALSVLIFGGAMTLKDLAAAEQVRAPTMSRLVAALEAEGLATKTVDAKDRRIIRIAATARGRKLLLAGRDLRVATLAAEIARLPARKRATLAAAADIIAALNRGG